MKECTKCHVQYDDIEKNFTKERSRPSGYRPNCKACDTIKAKSWRIRNKDKVKKDKKDYYNDKKDYIKCKSLKYQKDNKSKVNMKNKRWADKNKSKVKTFQKKYREENRDIINAKARKNWNESYWNDVTFRLVRLIKLRYYHAIKSSDSKKGGRTLEMIGCTIDQLKSHLQSLFLPGMSWDNYGKWHVDHIRPCASFDLKDIEQQKLCFNYINLRPLWEFDNLSKNSLYNGIRHKYKK